MRQAANDCSTNSPTAGQCGDVVRYANLNFTKPKSFVKEHELLSEFTTERKPKSFYFVLSALLVIVCFAIIPVFLYLKSLFSGNIELSPSPIILLSVVTIYPIIGCYGFYHRKKYGWVICSHYTLSATIIILAIFIWGQTFSNLNSREILKIFFEALIGCASLYSVVNLFRRKYLELFFIDRSYIFLAFMLTILFPLFWFGILVSFEK